MLILVKLVVVKVGTALMAVMLKDGLVVVIVVVAVMVVTLVKVGVVVILGVTQVVERE